MARQSNLRRSGISPLKPPRGRTADVEKATPHRKGNSARGKVKLVKMAEVGRAEGSPGKRGGSNRSDRRDTSPTYTGTTKHAARGNTPRRDVKTRKR